MNERDDIKALIDNELSPERAAEVQKAIDLDPELREEYLFMKQLSGDLQNLQIEPEIKGLEETLDKLQRKRSTWPIWKIGSIATGSLAMILAIGFLGTKLSPWGSEVAGSMSGVDMEKSSGKVSAVAPAESAKMDAKTKSMPSHDGIPGSERSTDSELSNGTGLHETFTKPKTSPMREGMNDLSQRLIIRHADMGVKVKDVRTAISELDRQVVAMQGIVESTNFGNAEKEAQATMSVQVPETRFAATVDFIRKQGLVINEQVSGQDVTAEVADTSGRIRALADEEYNLIQELQRARNTDTRLEIRSRLSDVRQQMQGLKDQNTATKDLAKMSRINATYVGKSQLDQGDAGDWLSQTTHGAGDLLGFVGRIFGVGLIYTLFLAPIWLPILGISLYLRRKRQNK